MMKQNSVPKATWAQIKKEYIAGTVSMRELSRKYSLAVSTISARARKEKWQELQAQAKVISEQRIVEAVAAADASNAELALKIIHILMNKLALSAEAISPTDTQAVRQITQCMKDLKEMDVYGIEKSGEDSVKISLAPELDQYTE